MQEYESIFKQLKMMEKQSSDSVVLCLKFRNCEKMSRNCGLKDNFASETFF